MTTAANTDLRNAEILVEKFGGELRYVGTWNRWLLWNGTHWALDDRGGATDAASTTVRMMRDEAAEAIAAAAKARAADPDNGAHAKALEEAKRALGWACKSHSVGRINAMVSLARSDSRIVVSHEALDVNPMVLNVANGTIDLRTGTLRPHSSADLLTKLAPVAFDPAATAPTWEAFLDRTMGGDRELISFLRRAVGYSLTGEIGEHALFFGHGSGANGKSTFFGTLHKALGDYASAAPRGLLFTSKHEQHPTELASLHGARFVTCAEIEEDRTFDEAKVKDLTGGDVIEVRRMREDFWRLRPTHKLWLAGNHKPRVRGTDEGIWRRIRLVPWTVTIPPEQRDRDLPAKLAAELPGVLAWAVRGCLEWQRDGLGDPDAVRAATDEYREESDPIADFFRLRCSFDPDARVTRKMLRASYEEWAAENGIRHHARRQEVRCQPAAPRRDGRERQARRPRARWMGRHPARHRRRARSLLPMAATRGEVGG